MLGQEEKGGAALRLSLLVFYVLIHLATAIYPNKLRPQNQKRVAAQSTATLFWFWLCPYNLYTALCAYLKPRNIFESTTKQRFQKYFCTPQSLNRLY